MGFGGRQGLQKGNVAEQQFVLLGLRGESFPLIHSLYCFCG